MNTTLDNLETWCEMHNSTPCIWLWLSTWLYGLFKLPTILTDSSLRNLENSNMSRYFIRILSGLLDISYLFFTGCIGQTCFILLVFVQILCYGVIVDCRSRDCANQDVEALKATTMPRLCVGTLSIHSPSVHSHKCCINQPGCCWPQLDDMVTAKLAYRPS